MENSPRVKKAIDAAYRTLMAMSQEEFMAKLEAQESGKFSKILEENGLEIDLTIPDDFDPTPKEWTCDSECGMRMKYPMSCIKHNCDYIVEIKKEK